MDTNTSCPFCQQAGAAASESIDGALFRCSNCGCFYLDRLELDHIESIRERDPDNLKRVAALLFERGAQGLKSPFVIHFDNRQDAPSAQYVVLNFKELLSRWPTPVPELINRSLRNVCELTPAPGHEVDFHPQLRNPFLFFSGTPAECNFVKRALEESGWVKCRLINRREDEYSYEKICVSPQGWARFEELTRQAAHIDNPAFVAMWFGKSAVKDDPDRSSEMQSLYQKSILPACNAAGFKAKRADTDEHNEPIMDRAFQDIRVAPFLIAELTNNNNGVYYEAGFAKGLGKQVIYCVPEGQAVHFDVTAINHVKWKDHEYLRRRLENRILGSIGRGPHRFDGQE